MNDLHKNTNNYLSLLPQEIFQIIRYLVKADYFIHISRSAIYGSILSNYLPSHESGILDKNYRANHTELTDLVRICFNDNSTGIETHSSIVYASDDYNRIINNILTRISDRYYRKSFLLLRTDNPLDSNEILYLERFNKTDYHGFLFKLKFEHKRYKFPFFKQFDRITAKIQFKQYSNIQFDMNAKFPMMHAIELSGKSMAN